MASEEGEDTAGSENFVDRQQALFAQGFSFSGYERDLCALNLGGGRFLDISGVSGVDSISDGRASIFADFDNDGDSDIFLTTIQNEGRLLFRNEIGSRLGFLRISLEGRKSGLDAWGAIVRVKTSKGTLAQVKAGGSGFLSQSDPRLLFGLGDDPAPGVVEVSWPSGLKQVFEGLRGRSHYRLIEGDEEPQRIEDKVFSLPEPAGDLPHLSVRDGERFPEVPLIDLDGQEKTANDLFADRLTLVNLWATWCVNCRHEIPILASLQEEWGKERLSVIGLSVEGADALDAVRNYADKLEVPYPLLVIEEQGVKELFSEREPTVPVSFLINKEGVVLETFVGWSNAVEKRLRAVLTREISTQPGPAK